MLEKITPPERITMRINEIDQMNIFNVIQTAKNNDINNDELKKLFKGIELKVKYLEYVKVIQYACLFDCVEITLNKKKLSEDDMKLLAKNAVYCNKVYFLHCDFTTATSLWQELLKHIKEHESDMRLERLNIFDMRIADECIDSFAEVLIRLKEIVLRDVVINKVIWDKLFNKIDQYQKEKGNCHLRLECLKIRDMEIADECINSFAKVLTMVKEVKLSYAAIDEAIWDYLFCNLDKHEQDHSHLRLERLEIVNMEIADECIDSFSKVLLMLKEVELCYVTIDKEIWVNLSRNLDKNEQDHCHLRLETLKIVDMEIAGECIDSLSKVIDSFSKVLIMLKEVKLSCAAIDKAIWDNLFCNLDQHEQDHCHLRLERLTIDEMKIADECIDSFSKVLLMLKEVKLSSVTIYEAIWDYLFCNIVKHEKDHGHLRLERLEIFNMEIADECVDSFAKILIMLKEIELDNVRVNEELLLTLLLKRIQHEQRNQGQIRLQKLQIERMLLGSFCPTDIMKQIEEAGVNVVIDNVGWN